MGRAIWGTGRCSPKAQFRLFMMNIRYLKTPSSVRFSTTDRVSTAFLRLGSSQYRPMPSPASQFMAIEAIITSTNQGSPQA